MDHDRCIFSHTQKLSMNSIGQRFKNIPPFRASTSDVGTSTSKETGEPAFVRQILILAASSLLLYLSYLLPKAISTGAVGKWWTNC